LAKVRLQKWAMPLKRLSLSVPFSLTRTGSYWAEQWEQYVGLPNQLSLVKPRWWAMMTLLRRRSSGRLKMEGLEQNEASHGKVLHPRRLQLRNHERIKWTTLDVKLRHPDYGTIASFRNSERFKGNIHDSVPVRWLRKYPIWSILCAACHFLF